MDQQATAEIASTHDDLLAEVDRTRCEFMRAVEALVESKPSPEVGGELITRVALAQFQSLYMLPFLERVHLDKSAKLLLLAGSGMALRMSDPERIPEKYIVDAIDLGEAVVEELCE